MKPSYCRPCATRFKAVSKYNKHSCNGHLPKTNVPRRDRYICLEMEVLDGRVGRAKSRKELESILLRGGEVVYDYADGHGGIMKRSPPSIATRLFLLISGLGLLECHSNNVTPDRTQLPLDTTKANSRLSEGIILQAKPCVRY